MEQNSLYFSNNIQAKNSTSGKNSGTTKYEGISEKSTPQELSHFISKKLVESIEKDMKKSSTSTQ